MEKALEIQRKVQEILQSEEVYLVGGSVRDLVMGQEPKDYDFTTSLTPDEMKPRIKAAGRRVYNIGNGEKHGTVTFKVPLDLEGGEHNRGSMFEYVEVTTHRTEVYDGKSRQPITTFGVSLDEDLARRDFTMNAMVLRNDGSIYDPYGGKLDIYAKQIKTVGMPKDRITEDPLRILRMARFAARYGFTIDPNFIGKARQLADRIFDVSVERWVLELDKLLTSKFVYEGLTALHEMGILPRILPELYQVNDDGASYYTNPFECREQREVYEVADEAWKFLLSNVHTPSQVKDATKTIRYINAGICARLKFSNDRTNLILDKHKNKG